MAVVAVPFILYLVRFCSPKSCKDLLQSHYSLIVMSRIHNMKMMIYKYVGKTIK